MNSTTLKGAAALVALVASGMLTACAAPSEPTGTACAPPTTDNVVILRDVTANAPTSIDATVACVVSQALRSGVGVTVIAVDGQPQITVSDARADLKAPNDTLRSDSLDAALGAVRTGFTPADDDGLDLLAAFGLAADVQGTTTVLVVSSGLQDVEPLAFPTAGMLDADPDELAAHVLESGSLTGLGGIVAIEWFGAGYGVGDQPTLRQGSVQQVRAVWATVLEQYGVTVTFVNTPPASTEGFTTASVVRPTLDSPLPSFAPVASVDEAVEWTFLQSSPIGFQKDSTRFLDDGAAKAAIADMAQALERTTACAITISGTTAEVPGMNVESARRLALGRATAVRDGLVAAGVDPRCVTLAAYAGEESPWYADNFTRGAFDPSAAALNRSVRVESE